MKQLIAILIVLVLSMPAYAGIKVIGGGDNIEIDTAGFPPNMKSAYDLMRMKCRKCHSLERAIVAIQTGVAPISGGIFDKGATAAYGVKMLRKPDSNMTKPDVKIVVGLLNFLLDKAEQ
ncbi:MAG: cytochrome C [Nitrospirae bacterium]|nr:cytochrome C [Nitrospirota bacterium]